MDFTEKEKTLLFNYYLEIEEAKQFKQHQIVESANHTGTRKGR